MRPALLVIAVLLTCGNALGMEAQQITWRGRPVLLISGEIKQGDAAAVSEKLASLPAWPHGAAVLLLNSPGGSVAEALRLSSLIDSRPVHTVIPKGALCASACASIVFIAGKFRTIEHGGRFGQHSCSVGGVKDPTCSELIAQHAIAHGVSHGSVAAFVTYVSPDQISWMDRAEADCFGITRYPFDRESGFEKSEPCAIAVIFGKKPRAQSGWRVDFKGDGYRAFQRTVDDSTREME
jgi:hypothetical protein